MSVPGTFYLITGLREYMGRKLMINNKELVRELINMGHEVGSHTHTHRDLTRIGINEVEEEFRLSKVIISELTGNDVGIAYPYGSFNGEVIRVASKYFIYGRTMGSLNRWNETANRYALGGMGARHLMKLPIKVLKGIRLVTVVFHDEPTWLVKSVIEYLRAFNARFVTLREGLKCLGL
jgi:peptidoglycan/xylan/chitin deacetylase (PgdA/CDA1 family)